jgi:6-phosphofructokinase 2
MVAGMVLSLVKGRPWQEVLQYGIAAGTATTMNPGTELCKKEDVERLYAKLKGKKL